MSSSGFGVPVLVKADGSAESLHPVPLTKQGHSTYDEVWLQRLLFAHPDALPIAEIDASFRPLIPLCMEMDTPAGSVDAAFVTPYRPTRAAGGQALAQPRGVKGCQRTGHYASN